MKARQVIVNTKICHQYGRKCKKRQEVERVNILHSRYYPGVDNKSVDNYGDQRPCLLRIPSPVSSPRFICPDRSQECANCQQVKTKRKCLVITYCKLVKRNGDPFNIPAVRKRHQDHENYAKDSSKTKESITACNNRYMQRKPIRLH